LDELKVKFAKVTESEPMARLKLKLDVATEERESLSKQLEQTREVIARVYTVLGQVTGENESSGAESTFT
jgi:hypothetical protein